MNTLRFFQNKCQRAGVFMLFAAILVFIGAEMQHREVLAQSWTPVRGSEVVTESTPWTTESGMPISASLLESDSDDPETTNFSSGSAQEFEILPSFVPEENSENSRRSASTSLDASSLDASLIQLAKNQTANTQNSQKISPTSERSAQNKIRLTDATLTLKNDSIPANFDSEKTASAKTTNSNTANANTISSANLETSVPFSLPNEQEIRTELAQPFRISQSESDAPRNPERIAQRPNFGSAQEQQELMETPLPPPDLSDFDGRLVGPDGKEQVIQSDNFSDVPSFQGSVNPNGAFGTTGVRSMTSEDNSEVLSGTVGAGGFGITRPIASSSSYEPERADRFDDLSNSIQEDSTRFETLPASINIPRTSSLNNNVNSNVNSNLTNRPPTSSRNMTSTADIQAGSSGYGKTVVNRFSSEQNSSNYTNNSNNANNSNSVNSSNSVLSEYPVSEQPLSANGFESISTEWTDNLSSETSLEPDFGMSGAEQFSDAPYFEYSGVGNQNLFLQNSSIQNGYVQNGYAPNRYAPNGVRLRDGSMSGNPYSQTSQGDYMPCQFRNQGIADMPLRTVPPADAWGRDAWGNCCWYFPYFNCICAIARNMQFSVGVDSFRNPIDISGDGNFGYDLGLNWGTPVSFLPGFSVQSGGRYVGSQLSDKSGFSNNDENGTRTQFYWTSGIYYRSDDCCLQFGAAYDRLNDSNYRDYTLGQVRLELATRTEFGFDLGFRGAFRVEDELVNLFSNGNLENVSAMSTGYYTAFARRQFCAGGYGMIGGGVTEWDEGMLTGEIELPINNCLSLRNSFMYIKSDKNSNRRLLDEETWSVSAALVWYIGGNSRSGRTNTVQPMFNVADNTTFLPTFKR